MAQAAQAVASARVEASQANTRAEATQTVASKNISSLRAQLDMMRQENMELKSEFLQVTAQQAQRNDTNNGTEILQML